MKSLLLLLLLFPFSICFGQLDDGQELESKKLVLDNTNLRVVEYISQPKEEVCGIGMHDHEPHLTVTLTDAKVRVSDESGHTQDLELRSGTSIWFDAETHRVVNTGRKPIKLLLIYSK